ncbi:hypothetical protein AHAT_41680 [Agarivorans sp. Toyoura001]|uniref:hypothetical protein n=1 Tax=Agarivorans sp. Toyoura001 TaxID=2283141 RepID=UPI0010DE0BD6|nr:hypothetical protein [Agarivorans sp. Toyoura001]GDY28278.1 hypothetical protein AHAT_41680 [Agarivorans sp. Toyoura001]
MSVELNATKTQISLLVSNALTAIKNRSTDSQWEQKVKTAADKLAHLSKTIKSSKSNVLNIGKAQEKAAAPQHRFSARQSTNSKVANMNGLENAVNSAMKKIGKQLKDESIKSPFKDKKAYELMDMLAGEVSSYDKLLSSLDSLAKTAAKTTTTSHAVVIQNNTMLLKTQGVNGPSILMLAALSLRVVAMMLATKQQ